MLLTEEIIRNLLKEQLLNERQVYQYSGPWGSKSSSRSKSCVVAAGGEQSIVRAIKTLTDEIKEKNSFNSVSGVAGSSPNISKGSEKMGLVDFDGNPILDGSGNQKTKSVVKWNINVDPSSDSVYVVQEDTDSGIVYPIVKNVATGKEVKPDSWVKKNGFESRLKALYIKVNGIETTCSASERTSVRAGGEIVGSTVSAGRTTTGPGKYTDAGKEYQGYRFVISGLKNDILTTMKTHLKMGKIKWGRQTSSILYVDIPDPRDAEIRKSGATWAPPAIIGSASIDGSIVVNSDKALAQINALSGGGRGSADTKINALGFLRVLIQKIKDNPAVQAPGSVTIKF